MMRKNLKLKQAVAVAISAFALSAQHQALALGLGDINVSSHLGQPFHANIKLLGAGDLRPEDLDNGACFRVSNETDSTAVRIKLGAVANDEATLTLSSLQALNEPIVNLSVFSECSGKISREYVILLDPALTSEVETVGNENAIQNNTSASQPTVKKAATSKHRHTSSGSNFYTKQSVNVNKSGKNSGGNDNIVLHLGDSNKPLAEKKSELQNRPRLSISSGDAFANWTNSPNLRMDKALSFTPDPNAPIPSATDADVEDEVTALNNRMAHLSEQVAKLQSRNLTLESDNKLKSQQLLAAEASKNRMRWIGYALGIALLLVSTQSIMRLLRRRATDKRIEATKALWAESQATRARDEMLEITAKDAIQADFEQTDFGQENDTNDEKSTAKTATFVPEALHDQTIVVQEENSDMSIMDHADVFLSHGRTGLAIQLLQTHLLENPKQSVTLWLFLLDLLAKEDRRAEYEQTALECKEHFNINIPEFKKGDINANQRLEDFPHLSQGLQQVWNTPAAVLYLDDLIYNNRLEPRAGFERSLIEELLMLKSLVQENLSSAEVIQLDSKKAALMEQKEAQIAAKKAEKLQKMDEVFKQEEAKSQADEKLYEFNLVEWK